MIRVLALLVSVGLAAACTPRTAPDGTPTPIANNPADTRVYTYTGPGASLMSREERAQMDRCAAFASWDYCRDEMLGRGVR